MAKSKKNRQKDFQKVKLKVGKKLPKGDNVTNLSFKTRQIKLTQRIKVDDGQKPVTRNKLSLQDLLRQCDHHSSTARVNAVCGLKEMWTTHYNELMVCTNVHGYGVILKKLANMLIDNEAVVRHSVINLFKMMLQKLSANRNDTGCSVLGGNLFTHIHAYMCCAMNHVHEDIKLDALLLFDCLLETFPTLMIQQTGDLLKNLVGLISAPSYLGSKGDSTTQKLSLNPDSKLPAMKFRTRVLLRMKRIFQEALNDNTKQTLESGSADKTFKQGTWSLFSDNPNSKNDTSLTTAQAANKFSLLFFGGSLELDDYITKPSSLKAFLNLSIPVLLQCWKEARASIDEHTSSDNLVSADSLEVMSLVMCVIQHMFVLCLSSQRRNVNSPSEFFPTVDPELLVKNYLTDFEKLFMNKFPYSVQVLPVVGKKRKRSKSNQTVQSDPSQSSLLALNLAVCDIMASFCADRKLKPKIEWMKKVKDYIVNFFRRSPGVEQSKILIRILKNVFSNSHVVAHFVQALKSAMKHYKSLTTKVPQKYLFFKLFSHIGQHWDGWETETQGPQPRCRYEHNADLCNLVKEFYQSLPELLLHVKQLEDNKVWLMEILTLLRHGNGLKIRRLYGDTFHEKLSEILDPQSGIMCTNDEEIQQQMCFLLSFSAPLTRELLVQMLCLIRRPQEKPVLPHRKSWSLVSHSIYNIIQNMKKNLPLSDQVLFNKITPEQRVVLSDYLRFMFSLQIGFIAEELNTICPESKKPSSKVWYSVDYTVQGDQWERHADIANIVAKELSTFYIPADTSHGFDTFSFIGTLEQLWKKMLKSRERIHILSACSLIVFLHQASLAHCVLKPSLEFYTQASVVVASVLSSLFSLDKSSEQSPREEVVWGLKSVVTKCLNNDSPLLNLVLTHLTERSQGSHSAKDWEKKAAQTAYDFLLSDEAIHERVKSKNDGENEMDTS
ncbi:testis-expressed protein 10 homolog isoform X2 [Physella acuta]|uniref:testis-expressed protein 10 homolog isoform X2 n=1 Tax=Physella acuta TaxID=109671 RepID=UPI0027DD4B67|nr:testis-expressed protein 10 homolog isoform X2 [Physella acuta]